MLVRIDKWLPGRLSCLLLCSLLLSLIPLHSAVHVKGSWEPLQQNVKIVTKFGFQETEKLEPRLSRGFIYGNITGFDGDGSEDPLLFVIVSQADIESFHSDSSYGKSCAAMMETLSTRGFESRCFPKGTADIFRWIPCASGEVCKEEETDVNTTTAIPGSQLTMQIVEPKTPEYWFVVLVGCHLDVNCSWIPSSTRSRISYDLWLTNGHPTAAPPNPFRMQFSFDEQDATQMYLITLVLYIFLCGLLFRARTIKKKKAPPTRLTLLAWVVYLKTVGVGLQSINMLIFSADGEGIFLARLFGEIFRMLATDLLCLLLLLLSRGWSFNVHQRAVTPLALGIWAALCVSQFVFFFCNFIFVYDILHDVDIFGSWPGYGMLSVRILFAIWFLLEVRVLIKREQSEEKAVFLAHFGAGFLVWFVYLPGLGVVLSFISLLWRFKIILGITTLANFGATCCLLHLFWPNSQNRKFFAGDWDHRRTSRTDSAELEDFERLLYAESESEEVPADEYNRNLHGI